MKNVLILVSLLASAVLPLRAEALTVKLGGAAVLPERLALELTEASDVVRLQVVPDCAWPGVADLIGGKVDVLLMSRYLTAAEIKVAKDAGLTLHPFTFAYEGMAVVTDQRNPLEKISRQQVDDMIVREKVMYFNEFMVSERPDRLGFIGVSRIKDANGVKVVPVDGLLPTLSAVQGRSYPYIRGIYIYTRGLPSGEVRQAVGYLTGSTARKILSRYGLVSGNN